MAGGQLTRRTVTLTGPASAELPILPPPALRLGGVRFSLVPILVGDLHTFTLWGLADTPAMLLGVDLLGLFHTVVIDLKRGELVLNP